MYEILSSEICYGVIAVFVANLLLALFVYLLIKSKLRPVRLFMERYSVSEDTPVDFQGTLDLSTIGESERSNYEFLFLKPSRTRARDGKTVTIRKDHQEKIYSIICMFPDRGITQYSYVENILEHHFELYQNEIKDLIVRNGCRMDIWKKN